jgi:hypothetical protein
MLVLRPRTRSGPMGVQEIEIVLNWFELLRRLVQTK